MVRLPVVTPSARRAADLADYDDLRAVISTALVAKPVDESRLRCGVWTFVITEQAAGALPEDVIVALTAIVDVARLAPVSVQDARLRQVILWCVEAYFGRLAAP